MPITWKTVATPQISDPTIGMSNAQKAMASGFNQINKVVTDRQTQQKTNWQGTRDFNTSAHLDQVALMELQGFDAREQFLRNSITDNMNIDREKIRGAYDARGTFLRTEEDTEAAFAAKKPLEEAKIAFANMAGGNEVDYQKAQDVVDKYGEVFTRAGLGSEVTNLFNLAKTGETERHKGIQDTNYTEETRSALQGYTGAVNTAEKTYGDMEKAYTLLQEQSSDVSTVIEAITATGSGWADNPDFQDTFQDLEKNTPFVLRMVAENKAWALAEGIELTDNEIFALTARAVAPVGQGGDEKWFADNDFSDQGPAFDKAIKSSIRRHVREREGVKKVVTARNNLTAFKNQMEDVRARIKNGTYVPGDFDLKTLPKPPPETLRKKEGKTISTGNLDVEADKADAEKELEGADDAATQDAEATFRRKPITAAFNVVDEQVKGYLAKTGKAALQKMEDDLLVRGAPYEGADLKRFESLTRQYESTSAKSPKEMLDVATKDAGISATNMKILQNVAVDESLTEADRTKMIAEMVQGLLNKQRNTA